jgi:hypothetical protein
MPADPAPSPRCAVCGRSIRPGRRAGTWTHRPGAFASCDLDADHVVRPAGTPSAPSAPPAAGQSRNPSRFGGQ